jgi:hypothetical protein
MQTPRRDKTEKVRSREVCLSQPNKYAKSSPAHMVALPGSPVSTTGSEEVSNEERADSKSFNISGLMALTLLEFIVTTKAFRPLLPACSVICQRVQTEKERRIESAPIVLSTANDIFVFCLEGFVAIFLFWLLLLLFPSVFKNFLFFFLFFFFFFVALEA